MSSWLRKWQPYFTGIDQTVWRKHLTMLALTVVSLVITFYSFSVQENEILRFIESILYAAALVVILLSHELGHYIHARMYGVAATLPFFIPLPVISPFGTLGAFIRMQSLPPDKKALFDISFWGPGMSFLVSIPVGIIGLIFSGTVENTFGQSGLTVGKTGLVFGTSMMFDSLIRLTIDVPEGHIVVMHPLAFASWVGFFVTAINLFPIGQLDGGHIAYVFLEKRQQSIAYVFIGVLIFMALTVSPGWIFWIILLFAMGIRHPHIRMQKHGEDIGHYRRQLGIASMLIFITCFIPEPLKISLQKPEPDKEVPAWEHPHEEQNDVQFLWRL